MTKLKSKKITKSTIAIIVMAVMLVALLAFGGTYAYFTATTKDVTSSGIKTGYIKLSSSGSFAATTGVLPGDQLLTEGGIKVTPTFTGSEGEFVAFRVVINGGTAGSLTVTTAAGWTETSENSGIYVYGNASSLTPLTDSGTAVDAITSIKFEANDNWTEDEEASDQGLMDAAITVRVEFKSIQVKNNTEATKADLVALFA